MPLRNCKNGATQIMNQWTKFFGSLQWTPYYLWQKMTRHSGRTGRPDLIVGLADHFEPAIVPGLGARAGRDEQEKRLERWCQEYPKLVNDWRDSDGQPFRHTYFYPAEQYDRGLIDRLAEHCQAGWGELEIHLHHGLNGHDTSANTRRLLLEFRDALAARGCLSRMDGLGPTRYAFVHGNFALANSAQGHYCGVNDEMQILAETGCYADFTLPSAPNPAQIGKINSLYECTLPLDHAVPHRRGRDLRRGRTPSIFPLIIQGPLGLDFRSRGRLFPRIENGEVSTAHPPTMQRMELWREAAIAVRGCPDWLFIKLHCHGMDPRDHEAMLGNAMRQFLQQLANDSQGGQKYRVHFVTAREMTNIVLAACEGRDGNPGEYRNHRLTLIKPATQLSSRLKSNLKERS
jgi:hypothetical protein